MRIAFVGASGTGKTTLGNWVAQRYGIPLNPVGSRSVAKSMGFENPYDVDKAGKRDVFQARLQIEKAKWENSHDSFVTDRTPLDEMAYAALHDVTTVDKTYWDVAWRQWHRYSIVFFCPVGIFQKLDNDPARFSDPTYHLVYETMLRGLFTGQQVFTLANADLVWRHDAIEKQIRYRERV